MQKETPSDGLTPHGCKIDFLQKTYRAKDISDQDLRDALKLHRKTIWAHKHRVLNVRWDHRAAYSVFFTQKLGFIVLPGDLFEPEITLDSFCRKYGRLSAASTNADLSTVTEENFVEYFEDAFRSDPLAGMSRAARLRLSAVNRNELLAVYLESKKPKPRQ